MNNRSIKDEAFVSHALDIAISSDGRWIANQAQFNGKEEDILEESVKSALVTATAIYVQKHKLDESCINEALKIKTVGMAREFIDKYHNKTIEN